MTRHRELILFLTLALATRCVMVPFDFINVDEAAHLVGSLELVGQGQLYRTFVDNKPPLVYFFYALGGGSMLFLRLLGIALLWLPLAWLSASAGSSPGQRAKVGALYLLSSAGFVAADTQALNTEVLGLVPVAGATWLFFRRRTPLSLFVVGALVGLAALAKQPFLAFLGAPALTLVWRSPGLRSALARVSLLVLGCISVLGLASALFALAGTHDEYVRWVWLFNSQHVSAPVSLVDGLARFAKMGLPLVGVSLGLWLLAAQSLSSRSLHEGFVGEAQPGASPGAPGALGERRVFLLAALATTLLPAFLGFRLFGHYFLPAHYFLVQLAVPAFLAQWSDKGPLRPFRPLVVLALLPGLVFTLLNPLLYYPDRGVAPVTSSIFRELGDYLKERPCSGPLFVWGYAPQVYALSERRPASRYVLPIEPITGFVSGNERFERGELTVDFHVDEASRRELAEDLRKNPPAYIADFSSTTLDFWNRFPPAVYPAFQQLIEDEYRSLGAPVGSVTVYERLGCASSGVHSAHRAR